MDWLSVSVVVLPYIREYAKERAAKLARALGAAEIAKALDRILPEGKLVKANEAFVSRFSKELDSAIDLGTLTSGPYQSALKSFLSNPSVQETLQAPLDGFSELNWELLRGIWGELRTPDRQHLIQLPSDFDWARIAKTYNQTNQRQMLTDPALRPLIQAISGIQTAEAAARASAVLERLAGPARSFDLESYAAAVKVAYAHLRLGSLDSDWINYEGRIRLESVYVPQSAKQNLPVRDITRDYLRGKKLRAPTELHKEQITDHLNREFDRLTVTPLMDVVDDPAQQRLVVLGDPGLGKSTLLKHLVLRWAQEPTLPLVLYVELRHVYSEP